MLAATMTDERARAPTFGSPPERPLPYRSRTEYVAQAMLDKIRLGELPVGQRLPSEQEIAKYYGVSRTVVREAVARMRSEGIIESSPGRGAFVRRAGAPPAQPPAGPALAVPRTVNALLGFMEVRRGVEAEMAALAASRRNVAAVRHLARALAAVEEATSHGSDGVAEDLNFHLAIGEATGNAYWGQFVGLFAASIKAAIRLTRANEARRNDFVRAVTDEHRQIFEAIAGGDPARARAATALHISNAAARILAADATFWEQEGSQLAEQWAEIGLTVGHSSSA
jgi:DNA-binding FadR family transcriptional regulator